jgi:hypothetical protein
MPPADTHPLNLLARIDRLLRNPIGDSSTSHRASTSRQLSLILLAAGLFYGAVMGTFGFSAAHWPQIFYSAAKVPLLLLATFALSLPSFFVINNLFGLRADFRQAMRALSAAQAVLTIVLASLAPFTALWYFSNTDYRDAILFNTAMFTLASFSAQFVLRKLYRPLISRNPRHVWMLRAWLTIFAFVGIQMGWVLRPYIGDPHMPTRFLRADALTNAYISLFHMIWDKFR